MKPTDHPADCFCVDCLGHPDSNTTKETKMDAKDWLVGDVVRFVGESNAVFTYGKEYDVVGLGDGPLLSDNIDRLGCKPEQIDTRFEFVRRPSDIAPKTRKSILGRTTCCPSCGARDFQEHSKHCPELQAILERAENKVEFPKIEQKPVCACCTEFFGLGKDCETIGERIRHDDPCQYTHLERDMLPKARAMFREGQARKAEELSAKKKRQEDLRLMSMTESEAIHSGYWKLIGREPDLGW